VSAEFAELFAKFFFEAIILAGGSKHTAHICLAEWWRAVEEQPR
jgi:hypothetical protein